MSKEPPQHRTHAIRAFTMPDEVFQKVEWLRRTLGKTNSAIVRQAINELHARQKRRKPQ